MDPRGLRARLTGAGCTSCGGFIPVDRIAVLADHGDLAFVEPRCHHCGTRGLSLVVGRRGAAATSAARRGQEPPIGASDVDAMHELLDGWAGDLGTLLDDRRGPGGEARA